MNTFALGNFGYNTARTATRPMPRTTHFGSQLDEAKKLILQKAEQETAFQRLCEPCVWYISDRAGKSMELKIPHFLEELLEKGPLTIEEMTKDLHLNQFSRETLQTSLEKLKEMGFVTMLPESPQKYVVTRNGKDIFEEKYPELKSQTGQYHDVRHGLMSFSQAISPAPK